MSKRTDLFEHIVHDLGLEKLEKESPFQFVIIAIFGSLFACALSVWEPYYFALTIIYPAIRTARALLHENVYEKEGKHWLSYWFCFCLCSLIQQIFYFERSYLDLPLLNVFYFLYLVIRCPVVIFILYRRTKGAEKIFTLLTPRMQEYNVFNKQKKQKSRQEKEDLEAIKTNLITE